MSEENGKQGFIGIKEASKFLRVSLGTMWRHSKAGRLPFIKLGRRYFTKYEWLERYLMEGKCN